MLDVKEAAQKASEYFAGLYQDQALTKNVQLEEVEQENHGKYWLITLSYPDPSEPELAGVNLNFRRKYKVFKVDAKTGEVKSMKIRKVE
jgi:hypothetical protein